MQNQLESLWSAVFNYAQIFFYREMQSRMHEIQRSGQDPATAHPGEFFDIYLSNVLYISDSFGKKAEYISKKDEFENFWNFAESKLVSVFTNQMKSHETQRSKSSSSESEKQKQGMINHLENTIKCIVNYHRELGRFRLSKCS